MDRGTVNLQDATRYETSIVTNATTRGDIYAATSTSIIVLTHRSTHTAALITVDMSLDRVINQWRSE